MDDLDGTWDDITGTLTITADNPCDFDNFLNQVVATNGNDIPFKWAGNGNGEQAGTPTNFNWAKYTKQFNNYLFYGNVKIGGVTNPSSIYWSNYKDIASFSATNFIDVAKNDGQEITGLKVLGDRLVIFKNRSIYIVFFTGDADIPFILPNGGKTNSSVGCVAAKSIQEVENGLVFLSYDGIYFFDGFNSFKISDKVTTTLDGFDKNDFSNSVSLVQKNKNRYLLAFFANASATGNNRIIMWDYFNNAFSIYKGIEPSSMVTAYVGGVDERPYFAGYNGFVYRADTGNHDSPSNTSTTISAYYYTNWKPYQDLINLKGIPEVTVYHRTDSTTLTFAYSYDFEEGDQYSQTFNLASGTDVYDTAVYGTGAYSGSGGGVVRRDLTGRGRVIRFKFENNAVDEGFRIDGLGQFAHLETKQ